MLPDRGPVLPGGAAVAVWRGGRGQSGATRRIPCRKWASSSRIVALPLFECMLMKWLLSFSRVRPSWSCSGKWKPRTVLGRIYRLTCWSPTQVQTVCAVLSETGRRLHPVQHPWRHVMTRQDSFTPNGTPAVTDVFFYPPFVDSELQLKLFTSLQCLGKDLEEMSRWTRWVTEMTNSGTGTVMFYVCFCLFCFFPFSDLDVETINEGRVGRLTAAKEGTRSTRVLCPVSTVALMRHLFQIVHWTFSSTWSRLEPQSPVRYINSFNRRSKWTGRMDAHVKWPFYNLQLFRQPRWLSSPPTFLTGFRWRLWSRCLSSWIRRGNMFNPSHQQKFLCERVCVWWSCQSSCVHTTDWDATWDAASVLPSQTAAVSSHDDVICQQDKANHR